MHPKIQKRYSHIFEKNIKVIRSSIHNKGVIAKRDLKKGEPIIEYIGEYLTKDESDKRSDAILAQAKKDSSKGAVYIFTLNDTHDIDGSVWYNYAKYINHSCNPNAEAELDEDANEIWIKAIKPIKKGEEITYDYGYDLDHWDEHPCKCGSQNCVGYIVAKEHWPKLRKILQKKKIPLHPYWGKKLS